MIKFPTDMHIFREIEKKLPKLFYLKIDQLTKTENFLTLVQNRAFAHLKTPPISRKFFKSKNRRPKKKRKRSKSGDLFGCKYKNSSLNISSRAKDIKLSFASKLIRFLKGVIFTNVIGNS